MVVALCEMRGCVKIWLLLKAEPLKSASAFADRHGITVRGKYACVFLHRNFHFQLKYILSRQLQTFIICMLIEKDQLSQ